eukprot:1156035-Pelagomonas_calceolata.AAC.7
MGASQFTCSQNQCVHTVFVRLQVQEAWRCPMGMRAVTLSVFKINVEKEYLELKANLNAQRMQLEVKSACSKAV